MLFEQGRMDLDAPVARYLPEFAAASAGDPDAAWRARVTVRMLLLHDSGLAAHREFFKDVRGVNPGAKAQKKGQAYRGAKAPRFHPFPRG